MKANEQYFEVVLIMIIRNVLQKFLWESSKTTRTKTCREKDKEQWMETKAGATGTTQEACTTTCFIRKTCSWKTETKGASKSSRSGPACSGSTTKTTLIFRACPGTGKEINVTLMSFLPIWRHATVYSTSCIKVVLSSCDFFYRSGWGLCFLFIVL